MHGAASAASLVIWRAASLAHTRVLQRLPRCQALSLVPHQQTLHAVDASVHDAEHHAFALSPCSCSSNPGAMNHDSPRLAPPWVLQCLCCCHALVLIPQQQPSHGGSPPFTLS